MKPGNVGLGRDSHHRFRDCRYCCHAARRRLDYLVRIAERILRRNPKQINYLAPVVTYVLTLFAGTGHTAFSMIPVIVEVAKEQNIRPAVPLSIAVVAPRSPLRPPRFPPL